MGLSTAKSPSTGTRSWIMRLKGETKPLDPREAARRARSRSVSAGFMFGVLLGAIFVAVVLAPWAASVAMKQKSWADPPPGAAAPPSN
ncbi:MAG: hypothetical protein JNJ73_05550 [Hyphomonadaceae bacterium]|nr:hypothetical protein [Hyphomonadaceae bacterium]